MFVDYCKAKVIVSIHELSPNIIRHFLLYLEELGHNSGGVHAHYRTSKTFLNWFINGQNPQKSEKDIQVFRSIALVPYSVAEKFIILRFINKSILNIFIKFRVQPHVKHPIVLMLSHPLHRHFGGLFKERLLCYEITDAFDKITHFSDRQNKTIGEIEKKLLSQVDIVFTSARNLKLAKQEYNENIHFIPNAADVDFFSKSLSPDNKVPADLAKIPTPRVGLIGHITANVDLEILQIMAGKHPEWSIIIIGKIKGNRKFKKEKLLKILKNYPNIHFLGLKPYESLPLYQKGLDVCLLPYKLNEFNKYVYPNKIHQYLAGGKPIVSTDLPEISPFANLIFIAKSKEDFVLKVDKALKNQDADFQIEERLQAARKNSAKIRACQRIELLEKALNHK